MLHAERDQFSEGGTENSNFGLVSIQLGKLQSIYHNLNYFSIKTHSASPFTLVSTRPCPGGVKLSH